MTNLEAHRSGRLLQLTLNRPEKRNALSLQLCRDLTAAIEEADRDPEVSALLLSGSGKAFCAGMDLSEALEVPRQELDDAHEQLFTIATRITTPLIMAVHGAALAGGTGLASNAHILVASPDATFGLTEIRIGLWPILIFRGVAAAVGERRATELALTGRVFGAHEAMAYGLVHEIVDDPLARAAAIAEAVSRSSADAVRSGLSYVNRTRGMSWEEAGAIGREIRTKAMESPDFAAGVRAFLDRRAKA